MRSFLPYQFEAGVVRWVATIVLVIVSISAQAQDYKKLYRNARDLFDQRKFDLAMEAFRPLIVYDRNNPYSEYSSFYFGVSALELAYHTVGRDMLLQLRRIHPTWNQMHEVNFWLAKSYFDQGELFQGMLVLSEIDPVRLQEPVFGSDVIAMKRHFLSKVDDLET